MKWKTYVYVLAASLLVFIKNQCTVSSTKSKAVGHGTFKSPIFPLRKNIHTLRLLHKTLNIRRLRHKIIIHHKNRINRLMHTRRTKRMPTQTLRRPNHRLIPLLLKPPLNRRQLHQIPHRSTRPMRINILHLLLTTPTIRLRHGKLHTGLPSDSGGCDHVVSVGVGGVSDEFGVDFGATGFGVFEFFEDDYSATAGDDESVAGCVEGAGGGLGCVVVGGGEGAHAVEHCGECPSLAFSCSTKCHI
mmetsp:Transcript_17323/g.20651  ORF Transcript_17323/g.20651 Transcript_17323/m.20651 type:complete len:245 (-) Transcript_17323:253-987(-)